MIYYESVLKLSELSIRQRKRLILPRAFYWFGHILVEKRVQMYKTCAFFGLYKSQDRIPSLVS